MKWLLFIAGGVFILLALGVIVLLLSGGASGRSRNEMAIRIARPAADVFPWLIQPDLRKKWILFVTDSKYTGEKRVRDTIVQRGQTMVLEYEFAGMEPPKRVDVRTTSEGFDCSMLYTLEELDGETMLRLVIDTEYKIWFAKLMSPLVARDSQKTWEEHIAQLKKAVEASAVARSSSSAVAR